MNNYKSIANNYNIELSRSQVEDLLDTLVRVTEKKVTAEITAASCRTSRDWDRAHEAEMTYENTFEETVNQLVNLIHKI